MKLTIILAAIALIIALFLPLMLSASNTVSGQDPVSDASPEPTNGFTDAKFVFTAVSDGEVISVTMADWLPGVVAGEMPAGFDTEALRAQAVASRTFIMSRCLTGVDSHTGADVCDDSACCQLHLTQDELREKWGENYDEYMEKIIAAVQDTDGEYLSYEGTPIQAVFHSSSAAFTEDASAIWGSLPYLVSVSTPETSEDVPNFISEVEVSVTDFASSLRAAGTEADLGGTPDVWVEKLVLDDSGRVAYAVIGGAEIAGTELREIFCLRSTAFTLEYVDGAFLFTVTGYGHGVGMSQYGANVMARNGLSYKEILEHYYPGTLLTG